MPPDMEIDMRHTKLTSEDAAKLSGELKKPSWQSRNEGIHERVSFEDTIWGFDLAGGAYYKTPLRVVGVKGDSRAEKAGIRLGDKLIRINDIDTSTLTIHEAHDIIIESGIHLKIAVSAPEDEEDSYFCYEDPLQDNGYDSDEERRKAEERARKREVHAKVSSYWSLQWPWVSKRRIIYRESNCFMVPSKYEDHHRDKFAPQPRLRVEDDIVLQSAKNEKESNSIPATPSEKTEPFTNIGNKPTDNDNEPLTNGNHKKEDVVDKNNNSMVNGNTDGNDGHIDEIPEVEEESIQEDVSNSQTDDLVGNNSMVNCNTDGNDGYIDEIPEVEEESIQEDVSNSQTDDLVDNNSMVNCNTDGNDGYIDEIPEVEEESIQEDVSNSQTDDLVDNSHNEDLVDVSQNDEVTNSQADEIINAVLDDNDDSVSKIDEDSILNSVLSDEHSVDNSESMDER